MSTLTGFTRYAFLVFFIVHIPITIFLTGPLVVPVIFPKFVRKLVKFYTDTFQDPLFIDPQPWFLSIAVSELLLQVPFFIAAAYVLVNPDQVDGRGAFRSACIVYGAYVTTTLLPILTTVLADPNNNIGQKVVLLGFYLPFLAFPLWLTIIGVLSDDILGGCDDVEKRL